MLWKLIEIYWDPCQGETRTKYNYFCEHENRSDIYFYLIINLPSF